MIKKSLFLLSLAIGSFCSNGSLIWIHGKQYQRKKVVQSDGSVLTSFIPIKYIEEKKEETGDYSESHLLQQDETLPLASQKEEKKTEIKQKQNSPAEILEPEQQILRSPLYEKYFPDRDFQNNYGYQENQIQGTNNQIGGTSNKIDGSSNFVGEESHQNAVWGDGNIAAGGNLRNYINGGFNYIGSDASDNKVKGDRNYIGDNGKGNTINGEGNMVIGNGNLVYSF